MVSKKKKRKPIKLDMRFTAMSKLIGIFIATAVIIIVAYSMYEMDRQNDLSSLSQLIIAVFGIAATYIGFYLTMAKWEHIEIEKTNRQKDLLKLKKHLELYNDEQQTQEDINNCNNDINNYDSQLNNISTKEFTNNY